MRVRTVIAHAFGPLVGQTLELADGMTVIYGPNESAKSSWHAALFAAICGPRKGAQTVEDRDFERRHRPWDRPGWEVSAELELADGRRVELRQDLDGKVACYAKDLVLGTDCSSEIIGRGGVPDAARWLGLDRASFLATACVSQAQILDVREQAGGLREHVQRAAATAGADATAAAALERIAAYRRDNVGAESANATKPLRRAMDAVAAAQVRLDQARADHAEYQRRLVQVEHLRVEQADARAAELRQEAARLTATADEAAGLAQALVTTPDVDTSATAAEVAAALAAWRSLAEAPPVASADAHGEPDHTAAAVSRVASILRARRLCAVAALIGAAVGAAAWWIGATTAGTAMLVVSVAVGAVGLAIGPRLARARAELEAARIDAATALARAEAGGGAWLRDLHHVRDRAAAELLAAAARCGITAGAVPEAVAQLETWLAGQPARTASREVRQQQRVRLTYLLDGATVADLRGRADAAAAQAGPDLAGGTADADIAAVRARHADATQRVAAAAASLREWASAVTSVADAEEESAAATAALEDLRDLRRVLDLTQGYLARAQERVHRDIAPGLASAVQSGLAAMTAGRYVGVVVDPGTLAVQVRDPSGRLRDASLLSHGTAEQIYLLLRVALADRLVRPGESSPLLLDEVTVHADRARTRELLRLLLDASARHQVVLFSQSNEVLEWARLHLRGERHAVRELAPLTA